MEKPHVTVLIPMFNRRDFVGRAIRSLQRQTFADFECIVIDDASEDGSLDAAKACAQGDARFRFLQNATNLGVGASLDMAAQHARGVWLTRLDSDDEYLPEHLDRRVRYVQEHPEARFLYGTMSVPSGQMYVPDCTTGGFIHLNQTSQGPTAFLDYALYKDLGGWEDIRYGEDYNLFEKAKQRGVSPVLVPFETYVYHRDASNALTRCAANAAALTTSC